MREREPHQLSSPLLWTGLAVLLFLIVSIARIVLGWSPPSANPPGGFGVISVDSSGRVGIGISTAQSTLAVKGNASIGVNFASQQAPADGLIVEGGAGIGTLTPTARLTVVGGGISINDVLQRGSWLQRVPRASATKDIEQTGTASSYRNVSLTIGADGLPVFSFFNQQTGGLRVTHCATLDCGTLDGPYNISSSGEHNSIAIGADGFPVISFYDAGAQNLKVAKCGSMKCDSISAVQSISVALSTNYGEYNSITVSADTDGYPIISFYDTVNTSLKVAKCASANCSASGIVTAAAGAGAFSSLAIGADGLPIIAHQSGVNLFMTHCSVQNCASQDFSEAVHAGGSHNSLAIGSDGLPAIAHAGASGGVRFVKCGSMSCGHAATNNAIDIDSSAVSGGISLTMGADGFPIILYSAPAGLYLVKCGNHACSGVIEKVLVASGDTALGKGAALGSDGLPFVAYQLADTGAVAVKAQRCGSDNCVKFWTRR